MTKKQYLIILGRIDKGSELLEDKWLSEDLEIQRWVEGYEALCVKALNYEIEHNLLPI